MKMDLPQKHPSCTGRTYLNELLHIFQLIRNIHGARTGWLISTNLTQPNTSWIRRMKQKGPGSSFSPWSISPNSLTCATLPWQQVPCVDRHFQLPWYYDVKISINRYPAASNVGRAREKVRSLLPAQNTDQMSEHDCAMRDYRATGVMCKVNTSDRFSLWGKRGCRGTHAKPNA